jgi:hypothetical protein
LPQNSQRGKKLEQCLETKEKAKVMRKYSAKKKMESSKVQSSKFVFTKFEVTKVKLIMW